MPRIFQKGRCSRSPWIRSRPSMMASTAFAPAQTETTIPTESRPLRCRVTRCSTLLRIRSTAADGTTFPSSQRSRPIRSGMGRNASRLASVSRTGNVAKSR